MENTFEKRINNKEYNKELEKYFSSNIELLEKLKILDSKKEELKKLKKEYGKLKQTIVITVSGTPRAGKTTCIDNLFEYLKKADLKTVCLDEPAGIIYKTLKNKEEKRKLLSNRVAFVEQQYDIGEKYIQENLLDNDIILCDRGILDTFIWYDMYYESGMINKDKYKQYLLRLKDINYFNKFYVLFSESEESLKRDYLNSLSIEPRTTMNKENIEKYNKSMLNMLPIIGQNVNSSKLIDTTNSERMDASITVINDLISDVKKLYLRK